MSRLDLVSGAGDWRVEREASPGSHSLTIWRGEAPLGRLDFIEALEKDASLRALLIREIAATPLDAVFWETPPITRANAERRFECVLVDAPPLAGLAADPGPFDEVFGRAAADLDAIDFLNIGGDARLVAPTPRSLGGAAHLAAFVRQDSERRAHVLLQTVARAVLAELDDRPLWVSTSGLGVAWLHVRLDRRPKYYTHLPYCDRAA